MPQYGYTGPRFNMDSTLSIPTVCGVPTLKSNLIKKAAIAFDSCNNKFYQYNPKTFVWSEISGGGTVTKAVDSVYKKINDDSIYIRYNSGVILKIKDSTSGTTIDTTNKFVNNIVKVNDSTLRFYKGNTNTNLVLSNGRFKNNISINADANARLGYWTNGQTIPVAGKDLDSAFIIITQKAQPVTYLSPFVTLNYTNSTSNLAGTYEVGANNLGTVTLSRTFTQRDGGAENNWTYSKIDSLGTSTLATKPNETVTNTIGKLTPNNSVTYRVVSSYDTGACKTNNLGQIDCTGRIVAGSTSPSSITYNSTYRRFWGYCAGTVPTNAEILAAAGGGSELNASGIKSSLSVTIPNIGYRRIFYAYFSGSTGLNQIKDENGFNVYTSWTKLTPINFKNSYDYYYTLQIYVTNEEYQDKTITYNSIQ